MRECEKQCVPCDKCGGLVCICQGANDLWAAHCMDCDNGIGSGGHDPCAQTPHEAARMWNELNGCSAGQSTARPGLA